MRSVSLLCSVVLGFELCVTSCQSQLGDAGGDGGLPPQGSSASLPGHAIGREEYPGSADHDAQGVGHLTGTGRVCFRGLGCSFVVSLNDRSISPADPSEHASLQQT